MSNRGKRSRAVRVEVSGLRENETQLFVIAFLRTLTVVLHHSTTSFPSGFVDFRTSTVGSFGIFDRHVHRIQHYTFPLSRHLVVTTHANIDTVPIQCTPQQ